VLNLIDHAGEARVQLRAHHTARGELATGISVTALSGIAMVTGVALTATGYGVDDTTMGRAGVITMVVSAPILVGSIWLIVDSKAHAEVVPFDGGRPTLMVKRSNRPHLDWAPATFAARSNRCSVSDTPRVRPRVRSGRDAWRVTGNRWVLSIWFYATNQ
jgi:hypothetical protein